MRPHRTPAAFPRRQVKELDVVARDALKVLAYGATGLDPPEDVLRSLVKAPFAEVSAALLRVLGVGERRGGAVALLVMNSSRAVWKFSGKCPGWCFERS